MTIEQKLKQCLDDGGITAQHERDCFACAFMLGALSANEILQCPPGGLEIAQAAIKCVVDMKDRLESVKISTTTNDTLR